MKKKLLLTIIYVVLPSILVASFLTMGSVYAIRTHQENSLRTQQENARMIAGRIQDRIDSVVYNVKSISAYWIASPTKPNEAEFSTFAANIYTDTPGLTSLQWVDENNIVRYVYPMTGLNVNIVGFDNNQFPNRLLNISKAKSTRKPVVTEPIMLRQGYAGLLVFVPIFRNDIYLGEAVGVLKLEKLLEGTVSDMAKNKYGMFIRTDSYELTLSGTEFYTPEGDRVIDATGATGPSNDSPLIPQLIEPTENDLEVGSMTWKLMVGRTMADQNVFADSTVLMSVVLGILFLAVTVFFLVVMLRKHFQLSRAIARESDFISLVSHQLRAPMTQLTWTLESTFPEDKLPKEQATAVHEMKAIARHGIKLVNDILNISRIERGVLSIQPDDILLASFIDDVLLPYREAAAKKSVTFCMNVPNTTIVHIDPLKAVEAVRNIVDNAIKYGPIKNEIEFSVTEKPATGFAVLKIKDHGYGIPKEVRDDLFVKSVKPSKDEGKEEGVGLGLFITKLFIEHMGGKIDLETGPHGTTFLVSLPLKYRTKNRDEA